jgi:hypothetical protein
MQDEIKLQDEIKNIYKKGDFELIVLVWFSYFIGIYSNSKFEYSMPIIFYVCMFLMLIASIKFWFLKKHPEKVAELIKKSHLNNLKNLSPLLSDEDIKKLHGDINNNASFDYDNISWRHTSSSSYSNAIHNSFHNFNDSWNDYDHIHNYHSYYDFNDIHIHHYGGINPSTGLPMIEHSSIDSMGNYYGTSSDYYHQR